MHKKVQTSNLRIASNLNCIYGSDPNWKRRDALECFSVSLKRWWTLKLQSWIFKGAPEDEQFRDRVVIKNKGCRINGFRESWLM